jgi:hypothetical protein
MKSRNSINLFLVAVISILMISACKKDNDFKLPDDGAQEVTLPKEVTELQGVRLVIKRLECVDENDQNDGVAEEFFGHVEAWVDYRPDYIKTAENYETTDRALMWYLEKDNYTRLKVGEKDTIMEVIDFVFKRDEVSDATININVNLMESDGSNGVDFIDNETILINAGQITLGESYIILEKYHDGGWTRAKLFYSFEKFDLRSSGILPSGKQPSDLFTDISAYPELPTPSRYEDIPPAISEKLIVAQDIWENFHPKPLQVSTVDPVNNYGNGPFYAYGLQKLFPPPIFVNNGLPYEYPEVEPYQNSIEREWYGLIHIDADGPTNITETTELLPLESSPRLQLIRFYKPLTCWRLPAGASTAIGVTYSNSWDETKYVEFSLTVGYGGELFSSELTSTFHSSWSYSGSTTESETLSYTAPEDKNVLYVVWQLHEEYRLINDEGSIFTDPNYQFRSMEVVTIPTDHIVPKAYLYDAQ